MEIKNVLSTRKRNFLLYYVKQILNENSNKIFLFIPNTNIVYHNKKKWKNITLLKHKFLP